MACLLNIWAGVRQVVTLWDVLGLQYLYLKHACWYCHILDALQPSNRSEELIPFMILIIQSFTVRARQAQQAQLGMQWRIKLSSSSSVLC